MAVAGEVNAAPREVPVIKLSHVVVAFAIVLGAMLTPPDAPAQYSAQYYELSPADRARLDALQRAQAEADAKHRAEMKAFREKLLRSAPLPDDRNVLLGRWRIEGSGKSRGKDDLSQLMGILSNPGGAMCSMAFGDGITEFLPKSWASIDSYGNDSLGPIQYRAVGSGYVAAIPAKGVEMLLFQVKSRERIEFAEGCTLVRVGAAASAAGTGAAAPAARGSERSAAPSSSAGGSVPQVASVGPARSTPSHPSPEVCRNALLDKLGTVGVNQVRAMSDVRFKELAIEGKVPNSNNLRIDLRGSACDDPRIKATLYDFDADGMLQAITYVWERPAGPAPAPIFAERFTALSRLHPSLPPPQSIGRLQGDTSLGRLVLQDMPERNLLLEAYAAKK